MLAGGTAPMSRQVRIEPDEFELGAEILSGDQDEWEVPGEPVPPPEDHHNADRLVRRLAATRQAHADADERYNKLIGELDAWHDDVTSGLANQEEYLVGVLKGWLVATGLTSVRLPHGRVKSSKGRASFKIEDEDVFMAWAKANGRDDLVVIPDATPAAVKVITAIAHKSAADFGDALGANVAPVVTTDGEVIPGVRWVTNGRSYGIET